MTVLGMADDWVYQGGRGEQLAEVGLDVTSIARRIREVLAADAGSTPSSFSVDPAKPREVH